MSAEPPLILAVDNDAGVQRLLALELSVQGFRVIVASDGFEALDLAESQSPDLVVLDLLMPSMDGIQVMQRLREKSSVPVIILTALDNKQEKVRALELGADDYLVKPFNPAELSARIRSILRRRQALIEDKTRIQLGDVEINPNSWSVQKGGKAVSLTRREWLLLQELARSPGQVILGSELLTKLWGVQYRDQSDYLRVLVSRLRRKLESDRKRPKIIETVPGVGYRLGVERYREEDTTDPRMNSRRRRPVAY